MSEESVKKTVRLPAELHQALKERGCRVQRVAKPGGDRYTFRRSPLEAKPTETEKERFTRMLREKGMLADTSWVDDFLPGIEPATLEEARDWLDGIPMVDWIIEGRGPR